MSALAAMALLAEEERAELLQRHGYWTVLEDSFSSLLAGFIEDYTQITFLLGLQEQPRLQKHHPPAVEEGRRTCYEAGRAAMSQGSGFESFQNSSARILTPNGRLLF